MPETAYEARERSNRDSQLNRLIWAPAIVNGSALVAAMTFIGGSSDVDLVFSNMTVTLASFTLGLALSAVAFALEFAHTKAALKFVSIIESVTRAEQRHDHWIEVLANFSANVETMKIATGDEVEAKKQIRETWAWSKAAVVGAEERMETARKEMHDKLFRIDRADRVSRYLWITVISANICFATGVTYTLVAHERGIISFKDGGPSVRATPHTSDQQHLKLGNSNACFCSSRATSDALRHPKTTAAPSPDRPVKPGPSTLGSP